MTSACSSRRLVAQDLDGYMVEIWYEIPSKSSPEASGTEELTGNAFLACVLHRPHAEAEKCSGDYFD